MTVREHPVEAGAAIYGPLVLRAYDSIVHGFSNRFAWQCPTQVLLDLYEANVSTTHLDVGVGSGYFLDHCRFPEKNPQITLVDLNLTALEFTRQRISRYQPTVHRANVLEPLSISGHFRSIAIMYLLHCLPGSLEQKAIVLRNLGRHLAPEGVLFGSTILGAGVHQPLIGRALMRAYNRRGIFGNANDSQAQLEAGLERWFNSYRVVVHGSVACFEARGFRAETAGI